MMMPRHIIKYDTIMKNTMKEDKYSKIRAEIDKCTGYIVFKV